MRVVLSSRHSCLQGRIMQIYGLRITYIYVYIWYVSQLFRLWHSSSLIITVTERYSLLSIHVIIIRVVHRMYDMSLCRYIYLNKVVTRFTIYYFNDTLCYVEANPVLLVPFTVNRQTNVRIHIYMNTRMTFNSSIKHWLCVQGHEPRSTIFLPVQR